MTTTRLSLLSAGAAQGLIRSLEGPLAAAGLQLQGPFGAVGAMREQLLAGDPCELIVLTGAMLADLERDGLVVAGSCRLIGKVATGVAVPAGAPLPPLRDGADLAACLDKASALYCPDTVRSTAGIHFAAVLERLGAGARAAGRLRTFPNGATAMRELAGSGDPGAVGCTQVSEILATPGVRLAGPLPAGFELATPYALAVAARATQPQLAAAAIALITGDAAAAARLVAGFEAG